VASALSSIGLVTLFLFVLDAAAGPPPQGVSPRLVFASPSGCTTFQGSDIEPVNQQINDARRAFKTDSANGIRRAIRLPLIPYETLEMICRYQEAR